MLTQAEAGRIADAITALRPEWNRNKVMAVLGQPVIRSHRGYADTAVALTALACDPATREPTRLLEGGWWWSAARPADVVTYRRPTGFDCAICSLPEAECMRRPGDHTFNPRPQEKAAPPAELKALITKRNAPDDNTNPTTEGAA